MFMGPFENLFNPFGFVIIFRGKWVSFCQAVVVKDPVLIAIYTWFLCRAMGTMSPCTSLMMDLYM